jgi:hypothetical protein
LADAVLGAAGRRSTRIPGSRIAGAKAGIRCRLSKVAGFPPSRQRRLLVSLRFRDETLKLGVIAH